MKPKRKVNQDFHRAAIVSAKIDREERQRDGSPTQRPDWMRDPGLLPKKPPGR